MVWNPAHGSNEMLSSKRNIRAKLIRTVNLAFHAHPADVWDTSMQHHGKPVTIQEASKPQIKLDGLHWCVCAARNGERCPDERLARLYMRKKQGRTADSSWLIWFLRETSLTAWVPSTPRVTRPMASSPWGEQCRLAAPQYPKHLENCTHYVHVPQNRCCTYCSETWSTTWPILACCNWLRYRKPDTNVTGYTKNHKTLCSAIDCIKHLIIDSCLWH